MPDGEGRRELTWKSSRLREPAKRRCSSLGTSALTRWCIFWTEMVIFCEAKVLAWR